MSTCWMFFSLNFFIILGFQIKGTYVFIAGSTGPLHIAGAFNKKTIGFYPKKKSSTSLRWETINSFDKKLSFTDTGKSRRHITVEINKTILKIQKFI